MTNSEKYINAFVEALGVDPNRLEGLEYKGVREWDSVGHMGLITALESAFEIEMDSEDIIDLSSFEKGKEILTKYDVEF
jgi:acyl carrier protein